MRKLYNNPTALKIFLYVNHDPLSTFTQITSSDYMAKSGQRVTWVVVSMEKTPRHQPSDSFGLIAICRQHSGNRRSEPVESDHH